MEDDIEAFLIYTIAKALAQVLKLAYCGPSLEIWV